jgi:para-nitrobenzyl esterase
VFAPNLDDVVIKGDPDDGAAAVASDVPLMTGFNADEDAGPPASAAALVAMVKGRYGRFAEQILALYPHASDAQAQASAALLSRDRSMASLILWSRARASMVKSPVYDYLYDHPFPSGDGPSWGAFHTAEVPYVFGTLAVKGRRFTAADRAVSDQLQAHWIAFMQYGDPSTAQQKWQRATPASTNVAGLGDTVGARPAVSSAERLAVLKDYAAGGGRLSLF